MSALKDNFESANKPVCAKSPVNIIHDEMCLIEICMDLGSKYD